VRLREIDPNGLTPLAALTALFELKKLAAENSSEQLGQNL
jgi:hypothetical protein